MRIAILGNSGSGKSTAARWFARRTGAPVLDLDTIAWAGGEEPVRRSATEAGAEVVRFCGQPDWIIEGCYADLLQCSLAFRPHLLFLDPGMDQCMANCLARPWEPHKYASKEAQDERLAMLLDWVRDHYRREGPLSYAGHRACFEAYEGPKAVMKGRPGEVELTALLGGWGGS